MRTGFFASHLLHWRVLIPVICELAKRGHDIHIQTTRAGFWGMPTFQMLFKPTAVTAINEVALDWVADLIGYRNWWTNAKSCVRFHRQSGEADCYVSTTKDLQALRELGRPFVAVGYQHLPLLLTSPGGAKGWDDLPPAFQHIHPFATHHRFGELYSGLDVYPCGFPHLDHVAVGGRQGVAGSNEGLIQDHGGGRGLGYSWTGEDFLRRLVDEIKNCGLMPVIARHALPGLMGADSSGACEVVRGWWPRASQARVILTTGSSAIYEMWSVGLRNVFVINYEGGGRAEAFRMFPDIFLTHREQLRAVLLCPELQMPRHQGTNEVIDSFRQLHDGQGAKRAADAVERGVR